MHEFQVGQRVKYIGRTIQNWPSRITPDMDLKWGLAGTVTKLNYDGPYKYDVQFDDHMAGFVWPILPENLAANITKE